MMCVGERVKREGWDDQGKVINNQLPRCVSNYGEADLGGRKRVG